jgi:dCMP deaminase
MMFMEFARTASKRATCFRLNVGAVLVANDKEVLSIGYNGPASGEPHCSGVGCAPPGSGCQRSIHAEVNALRIGLPRVWDVQDMLTLYVTTSPCSGCAQSIIHAGVRRVVYEGEYRDTEPLELLSQFFVRVERLLPNGQRIDFTTKDIV